MIGICMFLFALQGCKEEEEKLPFGTSLEPLKTSLAGDSVALYRKDGLQTTNFTGDLDLSFFNSLVDLTASNVLFPERIEVHGDSAKFFTTSGVDWYGFMRLDSMVIFSTSETTLKAHIISEDCNFFEGGYGIVIKNKNENVFYSRRVLGSLDLDLALDTLGSDSLFVVPLEFFYYQRNPD